MKIPKTPPDISELLGKPLSIPLETLNQFSYPAINGKYLHWDQLRHREPPTGLSHEQWWMMTKIGRGLLKSRPLGLVDVKQKPFTFTLVDSIFEDLHYIDKHLVKPSGTTDDKITNPSMRSRYIIHSLVEEAITSSQLEGAATTRVVAKEMVRSQRRPRDKHERMIFNNYKAMKVIQEVKNKSVTKEFLCDLQGVLTEGSETLKPEEIGRFRTTDSICVYDDYNTVLHRPPPADELSNRADAMLLFANGQSPDFFVHPVIRAIILHFWLAYDHPFADGNGRCARALFYWSMLRQGYWLTEFLSISQIIRQAHGQYGKAFLYTETDDNDLTYFIIYHLKMIRRALDELHAYLGRKTEQVRYAEALVGTLNLFNHRQQALLSHAIKHPNQKYRFTTHQNSHGISRQTARTDLLKLRDRGLLIDQKIGKELIFTLSKDFEKRLRNLKGSLRN